MFKSLALLTALVVATATMAKADSISITGSDVYNGTTLTFINPGNAPGPVFGSLGGTPSGIFSIFNPLTCTNCVALEGPINFASFSPVNVFFIGQGSNTLQVTLESISSVTGNLTITGNALLDLNGSFMPGVLTLTTQNGGDGVTGVTFSATTSAVPEPASLALFGSGLLGIVGLARRKFNV